jgi:hypothetical protein
VLFSQSIRIEVWFTWLAFNAEGFVGGIKSGEELDELTEKEELFPDEKLELSDDDIFDEPAKLEDDEASELDNGAELLDGFALELLIVLKDDELKLAKDENGMLDMLEEISLEDATDCRLLLEMMGSGGVSTVTISLASDHSFKPSIATTKKL